MSVNHLEKCIQIHQDMVCLTMSLPKQARRVVVTGLGLVCPLGVGVDVVWPRLLAGHCGVTALRDGEHAGYERVPCRVAAYVPRGEGKGQFDVNTVARSGDDRKMSLATLFALAASEEALLDADLCDAVGDDVKKRFGVAMGMGMVELDYISDMGLQLSSSHRLSPHFIPRILLNMAAGHISIRHRLKGPNHTVSTACTTGAHAVGDGLRFIQCGAADIMLCGSCEASISPLSVAGFSSMRALSSKHNHTPPSASRPFDVGRDGFVMGEGAGVLVLEELGHALTREAHVYGEVLGYGVSGDAHHVSSPPPDGSGAARCMQAAILDSSISSTDVTYVNAHATSTPQGDETECRALDAIFTKEHLHHHLHLSSTKGAVGHLLGGAGSVEAVFTVLACHHGMLPPNINLEKPDAEWEHLRFVKTNDKRWDVPQGGRRIAITNSFGFGGTNASLVFSSFQDK